MQILDGKGRGNSAGVDDEQRLETFSVVQDLPSQRYLSTPFIRAARIGAPHTPQTARPLSRWR